MKFAIYLQIYYEAGELHAAHIVQYRLNFRNVQEFNETKASKIMGKASTSKARALFSRSSINITKER